MTGTFVYEIAAQNLSPDQLAAELREADVKAVKELGGAVTRSKLSSNPNGSLRVEWSAVAPPASATPIERSNDLSRMLDQTITDLKTSPSLINPPNVGSRMSKLKEAADRIAQTKKQNDSDGDELMALMDEIEKLRPVAKATAKQFLADQKSDLGAIESTLRQLTNLPLGASGDSGKD